MSVRTNAGFLTSIPIGCGMDWFSNEAPDNWMLCQGQAISRNDYSELFAIIGTTYGIGDGTTTFNLPDFRGRVGAGKSNSGTFSALGNKVGEETHTQTIAEMPSHSHGVSDPGHAHNFTLTTGATAGNIASANTGAGWTGTTTSSKTNISINATGGGNAFNIIQPTLVCNKIIKVK